MEYYVNYPTDKEGIEELNQAVAKFHATLVIKKVEELNTDNKTKKKIVKGILEELKKREEKESDSR